jgi:hypothetical protein
MKRAGQTAARKAQGLKAQSLGFYDYQKRRFNQQYRLKRRYAPFLKNSCEVY